MLSRGRRRVPKNKHISLEGKVVEATSCRLISVAEDGFLLRKPWSRKCAITFSGFLSSALKELHDVSLWVSKVDEKLAIPFENSAQGICRNNLDRLEKAGLLADSATYTTLLRGCVSAKALFDGKRVHRWIAQGKLDQDRSLCRLLVELYAKCGVLDDVTVLFAKMHRQDPIVWNYVISAHSRQGQGRAALQLCGQMQQEGVLPNKVTFVCIVSVCARREALDEGKRMHVRIIDNGLESDVAIGTALANMYGKCGSLKHASEIFNELPARDVICWNAMITMYAQNEQGKEALQLFAQMQREGHIPDKVTFVTTLDGCASLVALAEGRRIHNLILYSGFQLDVFVGTALINMYGKCGSLDDALMIFNRMPERSLVSWNAMIALHTQHGQGQEALLLFNRMQQEGLLPDKVTFISTLDACDNQKALPDGERLHIYMLARGLELDAVVWNALVTMYGKCGGPKHARRTFDKILLRNTISWNSMIAVYYQHGQGMEALQLFHQMRRERVVPNKVTFVSMLGAIGSRGAIAEGKHMHAYVLENFTLESDLGVATALVNMYGKCGRLKDAHQIFDRMLERDVVLWSAIIGAYAQNDQGGEALILFNQMQQEGILPDKVTFISILDACASQAALPEGKFIHGSILDCGFESDIAVGTALVNMYGKCCSTGKARMTFDKMTTRNPISWNAMLAVYSLHGLGKEALELFHQMKREAIAPDKATFVSVLNACSHSGLLDEGRNCFVSMEQDYCIPPVLDHFVCMIDLFGRTGQLDEAESFVDCMPLLPTVASFMALLGACRYQTDVTRGERVAEHVFELDPGNVAPYVMLWNIYSAAGRGGDAAKLISRMRAECLVLQSGISEVNGEAHKFLAGDQFHSQDEVIYTELHSIGSKMEGTMGLLCVEEC